MRQALVGLAVGLVVGAVLANELTVRRLEPLVERRIKTAESSGFRNGRVAGRAEAAAAAAGVKLPQA